MQQLLLFKSNHRLFHGGAIIGKRKTKRPLCSKRPIHLVLKSKRGNFFSRRAFLEKLIEKYAKKYGIRVYSLAVNFDHIHFVIKIPNREQYKNFIRSFAGHIAKTLGKGLWALSPFTRVMQWGRDFQFVRNYLKKNREEASGLRVYVKRTDYYRRFLPIKSHCSH